jgi:hypothetical protein
MKIIDLPIVPVGTDGVKALDRMVQAGRTAVLVQTPSGHVLLNAQTAIQALRQRQHPSVLVSLGILDVLADATGLVSPSTSRRPSGVELNLIGSTLTNRGVAQALLGIEGSNGWLAIEDDQLAGRLGFQLMFCTCPSDPNEVFQPYEVQGGMCPNHGVPVKCR